MLEVEQLGQEVAYLNLDRLSLIANSSSFACYLGFCSLESISVFDHNQQVLKRLNIVHIEYCFFFLRR